MKPNYRLEKRWGRDELHYVHCHAGHYRIPRYFWRHREDDLAKHDDDFAHYGVKTRKSAAGLDKWAEETNDSASGKSWKRYTRNRHQWEGRGKTEDLPPYYHDSRILRMIASLQELG